VSANQTIGKMNDEIHAIKLVFGLLWSGCGYLPFLYIYILFIFCLGRGRLGLACFVFFPLSVLFAVGPLFHYLSNFLLLLTHSLTYTSTHTQRGVSKQYSRKYADTSKSSKITRSGPTCLKKGLAVSDNARQPESTTYGGNRIIRPRCW